MQLPALTPRRLTGLAALACAAALLPAAALAASASPAAPATSASSPASAASSFSISVNSATLVANGAAIRVVFTAKCPVQPLGGTVGSTTTQAVGDRVAQGTTQFLGFTCTGKPQRVSALAIANVNGAPFRPGIALVTAGVQVCNASCTPPTPVSTNKVLSIRR